MTAFHVEITEDQVTRRLAELLKAGENLTPAMRAISGLLNDLTEEAFARQAQPGGPKWAPLARSTIEGRIGRWAKAAGGTRKDGRISKAVANRAAGAKLLQDTGRLAASVHGSSGADFAQIGVSAVYAAIHQFGGKTSPSTIRPKRAKALAIGDAVVKSAKHPGSTIPARPYLPLAGDSGQLTAPAREGILEILSRHFGA
ncbi:phage virion morphogenesis protein [Thauera butanivorans]|uniref:phage virion morphogenesis protein n=1 Tax=Thauera butanivorans TaxID=86174 RepID=UPI003AB3A809